jgi:hypothetical protein
MTVRYELGKEARLGAPGEGGCEPESRSEVHGAKNNERHVCARQRDGELAGATERRARPPAHDEASVWRLVAVANPSL